MYRSRKGGCSLLPDLRHTRPTGKVQVVYGKVKKKRYCVPFISCHVLPGMLSILNMLGIKTWRTPVNERKQNKCAAINLSINAFQIALKHPGHGTYLKLAGVWLHSLLSPTMWKVLYTADNSANRRYLAQKHILTMEQYVFQRVGSYCPKSSWSQSYVAEYVVGGRRSPSYCLYFWINYRGVWYVWSKETLSVEWLDQCVWSFIGVLILNSQSKPAPYGGFPYSWSRFAYYFSVS